jgi:hypothetical protein
MLDHRALGVRTFPDIDPGTHTHISAAQTTGKTRFV